MIQSVTSNYSSHSIGLSIRDVPACRIGRLHSCRGLSSTGSFARFSIINLGPFQILCKLLFFSLECLIFKELKTNQLAKELMDVKKRYFLN